MRYEIAQSNRIGNRKTNQDRMGYVERGDSVLILLADGMGGYTGGELAADLFIAVISKAFSSTSLPIKNPKLFLEVAFNLAHKVILERSIKCNPEARPRTTGVACLIQSGIAIWAHVGDSRCYLYRHNEVFAKTTDHSVVEELIKKGEILEKDREKHPKRNKVTRCVGGIDIFSGLSINEAIDLEGDDIILLCSDGLWSPISDNDMIDFLDPKKNIAVVLTQMCEKAEKISYPNSDNISVAAMHYVSNKPSMQQLIAEEKKENNSTVDNTENEIDLLVDEIEAALSKTNLQVK